MARSVSEIRKAPASSAWSARPDAGAKANASTFPYDADLELGAGIARKLRGKPVDHHVLEHHKEFRSRSFIGGSPIAAKNEAADGGDVEVILE